MEVYWTSRIQLWCIKKVFHEYAFVRLWITIDKYFLPDNDYGINKSMKNTFVWKFKQNINMYSLTQNAIIYKVWSILQMPECQQTFTNLPRLYTDLYNTMYHVIYNFTQVDLIKVEVITGRIKETSGRNWISKKTKQSKQNTQGGNSLFSIRSW